MDLHKFKSVIVFFVALLRASLVSSKKCTNGFLNSLNVENYDSRRLGPLLEQYGITGAEQWIFPSMQFTCSGRLTKWMVRATSTQAASSQCRVNIATWRRDTSSFGTVYRRLSSTEGVRRSTNDGLVFTYEFPSPVQFRSGDIVGVELNSFTCSIYMYGGFDNILSLDISGTGMTSNSYRRVGTGSKFIVSQNPYTNLVPFVQPVIETTASEEPTIIGSTILTATNAAENDDDTTTLLVRVPLTSSEAATHEEMTTTIMSNEPLSTTTDDSSGLVNTNDSEPRDKLVLIIHIVTGVGIGVLVLLGLVITCIGLVGIMKCRQARLAKGRRRAHDKEEPQIVVPCSNGMLLQENTAYRKLMTSWSTDTTSSDQETTLTLSDVNSEQPQAICSNSNRILLQDNTAYRKMMNSWSTETTGYETLSTDGRRNSDIEQLQNTSNNFVVGYETTLTDASDGTQPQDTTDSNRIVVHKNTAYKKSTNSREIVTYESTSMVQDRDTNTNQSASFSGIVVHKNTAYKKSTRRLGDTVAGYETMDEIFEEAMQPNQAYGFQGESQEGRESDNAGDYETMTGDSMYDLHGGQTQRGMVKNSTVAMGEPVTYDVLTQQQKTNPEDSEHSYDYIL